MRADNRPVIFGIKGESLSEEEREFFQAARPWGYVLFGQNVRDEARTRALTDSLHELEGGAVIMIDQEGGRVARVAPPLIAKPYPSAAHYGALYRRNTEEGCLAARADAQAMGDCLRQLGINVNTAPVLDVFQKEADDIIGDRSYGGNPVQVAALGRAVMEGFLESGIIPMIKHIPGHGRAPKDSHKELPRVDDSPEILSACDFSPFKELAFCPMAMTAHVAYEQIDADNPATISATIIQRVIRDEIGFEGILVTDDLHMKALNGSIANRMCRSLEAGCDLALISFPWTLNQEERRLILEQVPDFQPQARVRCAQLERFMRDKRLAGFA